MKFLQFIPQSLAIALWGVCANAALGSGEVVGWGENVAGEATGVPSVNFSNGVPVAPSGPWATGVVAVAGERLANAVAVAADAGFSLALRSDGTVVGWGDNELGEATGVATPFPHRSSGPVTVRGRPVNNVVSIAAGNSFGLALKRNGTLAAWGKTKIPAGLSNVVAIAARSFYTVAVKSDGTVVSWANIPSIKTHVPAELSNVVAIACGDGDYERSMALRRDGTVVVWKAGIPSEEPVPPEVRDVVAIAAGRSHSLALMRNGTVFGWGFNSDGQATGVPTPTPPDTVGFTSGVVTIGGVILSNVVAIAAAGRYSLALRANGEVVAWGDRRSYRGVPAGLTNVVAIAAGRDYCLAITTNAARFTTKK